MRVPFSIAAAKTWRNLALATFFGALLIIALNQIAKEQAVVFIPGDMDSFEAAEQLRSNERVVVKGVLEDMDPEAIAEAEEYCVGARFDSKVLLLYPLVPDASQLF